MKSLASAQADSARMQRESQFAAALSSTTPAILVNLPFGSIRIAPVGSGSDGSDELLGNALINGPVLHRYRRDKERLQHVIDLREGFLLVSVRVLIRMPERNRKELSWMRIEFQRDEIKEPVILLKHRKDLLLHHLDELRLLLGFDVEFDDTGEHWSPLHGI